MLDIKQIIQYKFEFSAILYLIAELLISFAL